MVRGSNIWEQGPLLRTSSAPQIILQPDASFDYISSCSFFSTLPVTSPQDSWDSLKSFDSFTLLHKEPSIASKSEFISNIQLNKYFPGSGSSLIANDSAHSNPTITTNSLSFKSEIRNYLSQYIYHKPLRDIEHWLEYQVFPLELKPIVDEDSSLTSQSVNESLKPKCHIQNASYYEIKPNLELARQFQRYRFEETTSNVKKGVTFEEDNDPDIYTRLLGTSPDDSLISGLKSVANSMVQHEDAIRSSSHQNHRVKFYNRNVIVAPYCSSTAKLPHNDSGTHLSSCCIDSRVYEKQQPDHLTSNLMAAPAPTTKRRSRVSIMETIDPVEIKRTLRQENQSNRSARSETPNQSVQSSKFIKDNGSKVNLKEFRPMTPIDAIEPIFTQTKICDEDVMGSKRASTLYSKNTNNVPTNRVRNPEPLFEKVIITQSKIESRFPKKHKTTSIEKNAYVNGYLSDAGSLDENVSIDSSYIKGSRSKIPRKSDNCRITARRSLQENRRRAAEKDVCAERRRTYSEVSCPCKHFPDSESYTSRGGTTTVQYSSHSDTDPLFGEEKTKTFALNNPNIRKQNPSEFSLHASVNNQTPVKYHNQKNVESDYTTNSNKSESAESSDKRKGRRIVAPPDTKSYNAAPKWSTIRANNPPKSPTCTSPHQQENILMNLSTTSMPSDQRQIDNTPYSSQNSKQRKLSSQAFPPIEIRPGEGSNQTDGTLILRQQSRNNGFRGPCNQETCSKLSEAPVEVRYAQTVISRFSNFTVYEVLKSSTRKPLKMSKVTEHVFVVKG